MKTLPCEIYRHATPEMAEDCLLEPILISTARMLASQGDLALPEQWHIIDIRVTTNSSIFSPEEKLSRITGTVVAGPRPPQSPVV
jgi:hypothetical protein